MKSSCEASQDAFVFTTDFGLFLRGIRPFCCRAFSLLALCMLCVAARAEACLTGILSCRRRSRASISSPASDDALRWRPGGWSGPANSLAPPALNGRSTLGWTDRPDGHRFQQVPVIPQKSHFDGVRGQRIALEVTEVNFAVGGAALAGRLSCRLAIWASPSLCWCMARNEFGRAVLRATAPVSRRRHRRFRIRQARRRRLDRVRTHTTIDVLAADVAAAVTPGAPPRWQACHPVSVA